MDSQSADRLIPTQDQKDALAGTSGFPSRFNPLVTTEDPRLTTPSGVRRDTVFAHDGDSIPHGFAGTPYIVPGGSVAGEIVTVTSTDAVNFVVAIKTNQGESGTPQNITWIGVL